MKIEIIKNSKEIVKSYFSDFPVHENLIKNQKVNLSSLKKEIIDLYYTLYGKDFKQLNYFFYKYIFGLKEIWKEEENDNGIISIPNISIWQQEYLDILKKVNDKPCRLFFLINDTNIPDLIQKRLPEFEHILINDSPQKQYHIPLSDLNFKASSIYFREDIYIRNKPIHSINEIKNISKQVIIIIENEKLFRDSRNFEFISFLSKNNLIIPIILIEKEDEINNSYSNLVSEYNPIVQNIYSAFLPPEKRDDIIFKNLNNNDCTIFDNLLTFNPVLFENIKDEDLFFRFSELLKRYADSLSISKNYNLDRYFFLSESFRYQKKSRDIISENVKVLEKKAEWEKVIDELAHSLNTNIGAARNSIYAISSWIKKKGIPDNEADTEIQQNTTDTDYYITEAAELVDLTLDSLKVDINESNLEKISLSEIINSQIKVILAGIHTLRFSTTKHLNNVKNMIIDNNLDNSLYITTYVTAARLIIKDLLKNAILNTNHDAPKVSVDSRKLNDENCIINITNNIAISKEWADWINHDIEKKEIRMSKSRRVGMRVVKRWKPKLKWQIIVSSNEELKTTITTITIPFILR
jgi:hypothetical protein